MNEIPRVLAGKVKRKIQATSYIQEYLSTGIKFFMTEEATVPYLLFLQRNEEHFFNDFELVLIFGDNFSYQN